MGYKVEGPALAFEDVLLKPKFSRIEHRDDVDVQVPIGTDGLYFKHPLVVANMASVVSMDMALAQLSSGGLTLLHRFGPKGQQVEWFKSILASYPDSDLRLGVSVGLSQDDSRTVGEAFDVGCRIFCLDVAHADSATVHVTVRKLKLMQDVTVIAGNVCTAEGALRLWDAGADVVKAGVGCGATCTTRIQTGNGVPQLQALMDISKVKMGRPVIADGGIRTPGDVVKALSLADLVMSGRMFAGCVECCPPDQAVHVQGKLHNRYSGSSLYKPNYAEGVSGYVPRDTTHAQVLEAVLDGVRSGCSYQGVDSVSGLQDDPVFVQVTAAGRVESGVHDLVLDRDL